jgi:TfoX/Sxy family transcriptional regulator of competence genes
MAYNERLAERVRSVLAGQEGISERKMFGGLAFLLDGKMCVGVLDDELVIRSGAARFAEALKSTHARPMDFTGRPMTGMVYVSSTGVTRGPALRRWIEMAIGGERGHAEQASDGGVEDFGHGQRAQADS